MVHGPDVLARLNRRNAFVILHARTAFAVAVVVVVSVVVVEPSPSSISLRLPPLLRPCLLVVVTAAAAAVTAAAAAAGVCYHWLADVAVAAESFLTTCL